nr:immunoglobulin light chain junction region [Macaca mulatta]
DYYCQSHDNSLSVSF